MAVSRVKYKASYVWVKDLPLIWVEILPLVDIALGRSRGEITAEQVFEFLFDEKYQLWILQDPKNKIISFVITEVVEFPEFRTLRVALMAGEDFNRWVYYIAVLENFGRFNGCKYIEAGTRPGVVKKMRGFGFTKLHEFISKEL